MGHALDNTANAEFVNFEQNKLEHILTKLVDALAREELGEIISTCLSALLMMTGLHDEASGNLCSILD
jgi:hypothetical protein